MSSGQNPFAQLLLHKVRVTELVRQRPWYGAGGRGVISGSELSPHPGCSVLLTADHSRPPAGREALCRRAGEGAVLRKSRGHETPGTGSLMGLDEGYPAAQPGTQAVGQGACTKGPQGQV